MALVASLVLNGFLIGMLVTDSLQPARGPLRRARRGFELRRLADGCRRGGGADRGRAAAARARIAERVRALRAMREEINRSPPQPTPDRAAIDERLAALRAEAPRMQEEVQRATYDALLEAAAGDARRPRRPNDGGFRGNLAPARRDFSTCVARCDSASLADCAQSSNRQETPFAASADDRPAQPAAPTPRSSPTRNTAAARWRSPARFAGPAPRRRSSCWRRARRSISTSSSAKAAASFRCSSRAVSDAFKERHSREALHRAAPFNKGNKPAFHDPVDNFCKLELWKLTDYEKIVFLDADSVVVKPIDMLFGFPEFSGAPNVYETLADFHRLNSGVFVAEPSVATYERLVARLDRPGIFWRRTDQTFLETLLPRLAQAPLHLQHDAVRLLQPAGAVGLEEHPRRALPVREAVGGGESEAASAAAGDRSLVAHVRG